MSEGRLRVILDTNVLLVSISSRSNSYWIFEGLKAGRFDLLISNEILSEYEEVIGEKLGLEIVQDVLRALLFLPNVHQIHPSYRWDLITMDPDDNKFVDCAVAGNAHALVTEDRHFQVLRELGFPRIRTLSIKSFQDLLQTSGQ